MGRVKLFRYKIKRTVCRTTESSVPAITAGMTLALPVWIDSGRSIISAPFYYSPGIEVSESSKVKTGDMSLALMRILKNRVLSVLESIINRAISFPEPSPVWQGRPVVENAPPLYATQLWAKAQYQRNTFRACR